MPVHVPFVGGSYELRRKKADVQRSINLRPTPIESGTGKSASYLKSVEGLAVFSTQGHIAAPVVVFTNVGVTLTWTVTGSTVSITLSGFGIVSPTGTAVGMGSTTYTITAVGPGGTTTATLTTPVMPPVVQFLTACVFDPAGIGSGSQTFSWTVTGSTSQTLNVGAGASSVSPIGSISAIRPDVVATLIATGPGGTTTVNAGPVPTHVENIPNQYCAGTHIGASAAAIVAAVQVEVAAFWAAVGPGVFITSYAIVGDDYQGYFRFYLTGGYGNADVNYHRMCNA